MVAATARGRAWRFSWGKFYEIRALWPRVVVWARAARGKKGVLGPKNMRPPKVPRDGPQPAGDLALPGAAARLVPCADFQGAG